MKVLLLSLSLAFADLVSMDDSQGISTTNIIFQDAHKNVVRAVVIKRLSDSKYSVKLPSDSIVTAQVYGQAKNAFYRIKAGDSVVVKIDPQNERRTMILYKYPRR